MHVRLNFAVTNARALTDMHPPLKRHYNVSNLSEAGGVSNFHYKHTHW